MSEKPDQNDEEWFRRLAGDRREGPTSPVSRQADAVRQALQERAQAVDSTVPEASSGMRERLLFRLKREGLLDGGSRRRFATGVAVAASVLLGVALVADISIRLQQQDEEFAIRGPRSGNVWLNKSPGARLEELLSGGTVEGRGPEVPRFVHVITIERDNPVEFVQRVTAEAVAAGIAVVIDKTDQGYRILIDGLVAESPDQAQVKATLGITSSASGTVLFQVRGSAGTTTQGISR